jgi:lysine 2,3-aminomutase
MAPGFFVGAPLSRALGRGRRRTVEKSAWQLEWARSLSTVEDLRDAGLVSAEEAERLRPVLERYRFRLPRYYAALIDRANPSCPIRRQAIPSVNELVDPAAFQPDPLGDLRHQPVARVTHRYRGRALLHVTPNCSMYCRYCFRKTLLNELSGELFSGAFDEALAYFRRGTVEEVILSGGDPLLVPDTTLEQLAKALGAIPQVRRFRVHTRVPVTFPARIDRHLIEALSRFPRTKVVVTHFNHPREVTEASLAAVGTLRDGGVTVLNQSVLLAGVNDDADVLAELSVRLFDGGVVPYYLHHPDRAAGTSAFDVATARGLAVHGELRRRLPGYLVPRYVVDLGDGEAKTPVAELP